MPCGATLKEVSKSYHKISMPGMRIIVSLGIACTDTVYDTLLAE